jgi:hypothetical protein
MYKYPSYPVQTGANCVAYAFATAIEVALAEYPPEYWQRIDRRQIETIVGAPAHLHEAAEKLSELYPWLKMRPMFGVVCNNISPLVCLTQRYGYAHAVTALPRGREYDPLVGDTQLRQEVMPVNHVYVVVLAPPVADKWMRYSWYRWLRYIAVPFVQEKLL